MPHRKIFWVFLLTLMVGSLACSSGRLTTRDASQKLKPLATLPEREQAQTPTNMAITVQNVADAGKSYRNFVVLYINGKEIEPEGATSNMKSAFKYGLHLQPGIYDVKAEYHVVGFWKERVYSITTDEPVKILPGKRTSLTIRLEKDVNGFPLRKKNLFAMRYEALADEGVTTAEPLAVPVSAEVVAAKAPVLVTPQLTAETVAPAESTTAIKPSEALVATKVALQINTVPLGANVYIDDRFVGQAPVRVAVNSGEGHVVQIARDGYREYLKVIDAGELAGRTDMQIIVRLEEKTP